LCARTLQGVAEAKKTLWRVQSLKKLRTDSTVVCMDPARSAEVEKPLRFKEINLGRRIGS
jgi:hypothetical protein